MKRFKQNVTPSTTRWEPFLSCSNISSTIPNRKNTDTRISRKGKQKEVPIVHSGYQKIHQQKKVSQVKLSQVRQMAQKISRVTAQIRAKKREECDACLIIIPKRTRWGPFWVENLECSSTLPFKQLLLTIIWKVKYLPKGITSTCARGDNQGILGEISWKPVGP